MLQLTLKFRDAVEDVGAGVEVLLSACYCFGGGFESLLQEVRRFENIGIGSGEDAVEKGLLIFVGYAGHKVGGSALARLPWGRGDIHFSRCADDVLLKVALILHEGAKEVGSLTVGLKALFR